MENNRAYAKPQASFHAGTQLNTVASVDSGLVSELTEAEEVSEETKQDAAEFLKPPEADGFAEKQDESEIC